MSCRKPNQRKIYVATIYHQQVSNIRGGNRIEYLTQKLRIAANASETQDTASHHQISGCDARNTVKMISQETPQALTVALWECNANPVIQNMMQTEKRTDEPVPWRRVAFSDCCNECLHQRCYLPTLLVMLVSLDGIGIITLKSKISAR